MKLHMRFVRARRALACLVGAALAATVLVGQPLPVGAASPAVVSTLAGNGTGGNSGASGPATKAELNFCSNSGYGTTCGSSLAQDSRGNLYFPEEGNNTIQMLAESRVSSFLPRVHLVPGNIYTVAGNGTCGDEGDGTPATFAELCAPSSVAFDKSGNLVIADFYNGVVRLLAGSVSDSLLPGTRLTPGDIYLLAGGTTSSPCTGNGCPGPSAHFANPSGVAVAPNGDLAIADMGNNRVWLLAARASSPLLPRLALKPGDLYLVAGDDAGGYGGDFGPAPSATLTWPFGVTFDGHGNLYISTPRSGRIRMVAAARSNPLLPRVRLVPGDIYTVAGNGTQGYSGDGGPAIDAEIDQAVNSPGTTTPKYGGVAVDAAGNLYIPDASNQVIRLVAAGRSDPYLPGKRLVPGDIYTIAGDGHMGYRNGTAMKAELFAPSSVLLYKGSLLFIDGGNAVVRSIEPGSSEVSATDKALQSLQQAADSYVAQSGVIPGGRQTGTLVAAIVSESKAGCDVFFGPRFAVAAGVGGGVGLGVDAGDVGPIPNVAPFVDVYAGLTADFSLAEAGCHAGIGYAAELGVTPMTLNPDENVIGVLIPITSGDWCFYRDVSATQYWEQHCGYLDSSSNSSYIGKELQASYNQATSTRTPRVTLTRRQVGVWVFCFGGNPKASCRGRLQLKSGADVLGQTDYLIAGRAQLVEVPLTRAAVKMIAEAPRHERRVEISVGGSPRPATGDRTLVVSS